MWLGVGKYLDNTTHKCECICVHVFSLTTRRKKVSGTRICFLYCYIANKSDRSFFGETRIRGIYHCKPRLKQDW